MYGPCCELAACKFENDMGKIRSMVRSNFKVLEQIHNRYRDINRSTEKIIKINDRDSYFNTVDDKIVRVEGFCN